MWLSLANALPIAAFGPAIAVIRKQRRSTRRAQQGLPRTKFTCFVFRCGNKRSSRSAAKHVHRARANLRKRVQRKAERRRAAAAATAAGRT